MKKINFSLKEDDEMMRRWGPVLRDDLILSPNQSENIATTIFRELRDNTNTFDLNEAKDILSTERFNELSIFINYSAGRQPTSEFENRAHLILWNYMCFVYLSDACFKKFQKHIPENTVAGKCYRYLNQKRIRSFRNAMAHGNWKVIDGAIIYWDRKRTNEPYQEFQVNNSEREFWSFLSLCVAKSTYAAIQEE